MKVPSNILDFLNRAEHVYGDRVGVADEPDQPAGLPAYVDQPWKVPGSLQDLQAASKCRGRASLTIAS
jgi:hypothetical protein